MLPWLGLTSNPSNFDTVYKGKLGLPGLTPITQRDKKIIQGPHEVGKSKKVQIGYKLKMWVVIFLLGQNP